MRYFGGILRWFTATETPRWVLISGAVLTLATTSLSTIYLQDKNRIDSSRSAMIQSMIDSGGQFQVFASAFSTEMFENKNVSTETRINLISNLNEQYYKLKDIAPFLPKEGQKIATLYQNSLIKMRKRIDAVHDIMSMKDFWSQASDLTLFRNKLNHELLNAI